MPSPRAFRFLLTCPACGTREVPLMSPWRCPNDDWHGSFVRLGLALGWLKYAVQGPFRVR